MQTITITDWLTCSTTEVTVIREHRLPGENARTDEILVGFDNGETAWIPRP